MFYFLLDLLSSSKEPTCLLMVRLVLARRYGISDIVIGLTIVSFGTSAPELVVNLIASSMGILTLHWVICLEVTS